MQEDAFSEKEVAGPSTPDGTAPPATQASTRSQDGGNAKERKDKEGVTVLQFPAFLLPPTPESPPPRRGPLSWAYWAGRRRGSG